MQTIIEFFSRNAEGITVSLVVSFLTAAFVTPWVGHKFALARDKRNAFRLAAENLHLAISDETCFFSASPKDIETFRIRCSARRLHQFDRAHNNWLKHQRERQSQATPFGEMPPPPPELVSAIAELKKAVRPA